MDPTRDTAKPPRPPGMGKGALLALAVHGLLVLALAWGVSWRSSTPDAVEAELWSAVPQAAAPRAAQPEPAPEPAPPPPPPPPRPAPPQPAPPPEVADAQIAIEKARREAERREQQRLKDKLAAEKLAREKEKEREREKEKERQRELAEQRQQKERQEKERQAKIEAARQAQLKRLMGQAGATSDGAGNAARASGPSAGYGGRIKARVKPNIVFSDNLSTNPVAEVEVRLAADGRIISQKLLVSSGVKEWDDAVLRALERTEVLPRDVDGTVPSSMVLSFRPRD